MNGFYADFVDAVEHAAGDGPILILWILSILYMWIFMPQVRRLLVVVVVVVLALANPISGGLAMYVVEDPQPFSRFIWLMFPEILAAVAACDLCLRVSRIWLRIPILAACAALIIWTGRLLPSREFFQKPQNEYQISEDALEVGDYLLKKQEHENAVEHLYANRKAQRSPHTRAIVAEELCYDIRQARSGVHLYYGRHGIRLKNRIESRLIASSDEEATRAYFDRILAAHVSAIVLRTDEGVEAVMEHFGWIPEAQVGTYTVYVPE